MEQNKAEAIVHIGQGLFQAGCAIILLGIFLVLGLVVMGMIL